MRFSEFKSRWKRVSTLSLCALARSVRELIICWSDQNKQTKAVPIYMSEIFSIKLIIFDAAEHVFLCWSKSGIFKNCFRGLTRSIGRSQLSIWIFLKSIFSISHKLTTPLVMTTCACHKYGTRKLCLLNESTRFSDSKDDNRVNTNFILEKCQVGPSTTIYYFHN